MENQTPQRWRVDLKSSCRWEIRYPRLRLSQDTQLVVQRATGGFHPPSLWVTVLPKIEPIHLLAKSSYFLPPTHGANRL